MTSEPILKDVADYLKRGWPVVPVHVQRTDEGKRVTFLSEHGFNDATTDYDVVADWLFDTLNAGGLLLPDRRVSSR